MILATAIHCIVSAIEEYRFEMNPANGIDIMEGLGAPSFVHGIRCIAIGLLRYCVIPYGKTERLSRSVFWGERSAFRTKRYHASASERYSRKRGVFRMGLKQFQDSRWSAETLLTVFAPFSLSGRMGEWFSISLPADSRR